MESACGLICFDTQAVRCPRNQHGAAAVTAPPTGSQPNLRANILGDKKPVSLLIENNSPYV